MLLAEVPDEQPVSKISETAPHTRTFRAKDVAFVDNERILPTALILVEFCMAYVLGH